MTKEQNIFVQVSKNTHQRMFVMTCKNFLEVPTMAKKFQQSGTNIQQVRQQNAQSANAGAAGSFGTEFASETNAQQVRQQNAQAEQNKSQNS